jgi:hypothetical protein
MKSLNVSCVKDKCCFLLATNLPEALPTNCVLQCCFLLAANLPEALPTNCVLQCCFLLAAHLPEALRTNCAKCTDAQKSIIKRASKYLVANRASDWSDITNKYDPERKYRNSFQRFLNEE